MYKYPRVGELSQKKSPSPSPTTSPANCEWPIAASRPSAGRDSSSTRRGSPSPAPRRISHPAGGPASGCAPTASCRRNPCCRPSCAAFAPRT